MVGGVIRESFSEATTLKDEKGQVRGNPGRRAFGLIQVPQQRILRSMTRVP